MKLTLKKSDKIGAITSTLCLLHCLATPLLFVISAENFSSQNTTPFWWSNIDYVFLSIGFLAVLQSTKNTSKKIMKITLWTSWIILFFLITNEKLELFHIPEIFTYITSITLAVLHLYNLKYCTCKEHTCCAASHK